MNNLLDVLFRFPHTKEAGLDFVGSVLNLIAMPILAVDKKMHVHVSNLQGRDILLRSQPDSKGGEKHGKGRRRKRPHIKFPDVLGKEARMCVVERRAGLVRDFAAPGLRGGSCDVILCPGEVQGLELCFLVLLTSYSGDDLDLDSALKELLEHVDGAAAFIDTEIRFRAFNRRFLSTFNAKEGELMGVKVSEHNPSEQAVILENQIRHLMAHNEIRDSRADNLSTRRIGVVVASIKAWPLMSEEETREGLFVIVRPSPVSTPLPLVDETAQELFGRVAITHGPPMCFTQLDGKVIAMNAAAKAIITGAGDGPVNLKTAIPWAQPEMIENLYQDVLSGSEYSGFLSDIATPNGTRTFMVRAFGLKELGDITSEILVHIQDVTEAENSRNLLAETARKLATEKGILDAVVGGLSGVRVAFAVVDRELTILRVSESVLSGFDKDASFFVGRKVYDVDPSTRDSGIIAYIKTAIDRGQDISMERVPYTIPGGRQTLLALRFHPFRMDGKDVCLVTAENLTEQLKMEADLKKMSRRLDTVMADVDEVVIFTDLQGTLIDVNQVLAARLGRKREDLIGRPMTEILAIEEPELILDFIRRAVVSRQPVKTGRLKLTSKIHGPVFVEVSYVPLIGPDGAIEEIAHIARYMTQVVDLEEQVKDYTDNLERLVSERTEELSQSNALLENTIERLASMARSGMVLSSLKDSESVMASFLKEVREVLAADFASVALVSGGDGTSKTTYYSSGSTPPSGEIPSNVVEQSLARLAIGNGTGDDLEPANPHTLIEEFVFSKFRGLLVTWREKSEFTTLDGNLIKLLCTQLSFSLPITSYVTDLRAERDRSQALRRIAFRTAGTASVGSAIRIVAEELAKVVRADRFFWIVSGEQGDLWVNEVFRGSGLPVRQAKHIGAGQSDCLGRILTACEDSHRLFCERFPRFGGEGFDPGTTHTRSSLFPFVRKDESGKLGECLKSILREVGFLGRDEGGLGVAPVTLSPNSWGMLCAHSEVGPALKEDDSCFMCLAASTVGHMWQAADAASSVRRLEAEGETVSELAHDIKYPLIKIRDSIASITSRDQDLLGDATLKEMQTEIDRLNLLAQELIEISNRKKMRPEIVDIAELLDYCISITSGDAADKSVEVRRHIESVAPPIFASRQDVKNILINVLANCIEAAGEKGWVDIEVEADGTRAGSGCVAILIKDSGPGVGEGEVDRIFDPFYSTRVGGSGVGLFSAKKRANANGGDVVYEVGPDGRSGFVVWFPQASG